MGAAWLLDDDCAIELLGAGALVASPGKTADVESAGTAVPVTVFVVFEALETKNLESVEI